MVMTSLWISIVPVKNYLLCPKKNKKYPPLQE